MDFFSFFFQENGDRHTKDGIENDEPEVVENGVPRDDKRVLGSEKILEIAEACPGTSENALGIIEFLKCDNQAVERHVVIDEEINKSRKSHKKNGNPAFEILFFLRSHSDDPSEKSGFLRDIIIIMAKNLEKKELSDVKLDKTDFRRTVISCTVWVKYRFPS